MKHIWRYAAALMVAVLMGGVGTGIQNAGASEMTPYEPPFGKWMVRVRAMAILPDTDADVSVNNVATPLNGLEIDDRVIPELDITYFLTNNIAVELVLGISKHDVTGTGGLAGVDVGDFISFLRI